MALLTLTFETDVWEWRGPAPYYFCSIPPDEALLIRELATELTYGWGVIPVHGRVGATEFTTSLFPKDGGYAVPLKNAVRSAENIAVGDRLSLRLDLG